MKFKHFFLALSLFGITVSAAAADGSPLDLLPEGVRTFIRSEQQLLSRSVDPNRLNMGVGNLQDPRYAPETGGVFKLESFWVDESALHAFPGDGLSRDLKGMLLRTVEGKRQVRFFVHPESRSLYADFLRGAEPAETFYATATSSSRSLVVWKEDVAPFFAKVSLNKEVSAIVRTIPISEISRSIGTNNTLVKSSKVLPAGFEWMKETFGAIPKGMSRGGMLIREFPPGIVEGKRSMVSLFALYGGNRAQGPPLLVDMIRKSGEPPVEFIRNRILKPFAEIWIASVLDAGFSMEAHAQNSLLELDEKGLPTGRYIFRDLGGFDVDFAYRHRLGLPDPAQLPVIAHFGNEYHQDELGKALRQSIYNHYVGGFVYNLDQEVPKWMAEGAITSETIVAGGFTAELQLAFRDVYQRRTGITLPKAVDFSALDEIMARARKGIFEDIAARNQPRGLGRRVIDFLFSGLTPTCPRILDENY